MKKVYLLAVMLLCSIMAFSQVKKVAILEIVDREGKVSYSQKLMLRASLGKAVTNTAGYEAYDRTDMDAIMGEQDFQRTGMVSDDQIKRLGEITGAAYILVAEAAKIDDANLFVTAKILDVETARTEQTDYVTVNLKSMLQGCEELAGKLLKTTPTEVVDSIPEVVSQKTTADIGTPTLVRIGNEYSYNGQYFTKREYQNLLRNTCPEAYAQYKKGKKLIGAGWGLFATGLVITGGGYAMLIISNKMPYYHEERVEMFDGNGYYIGAEYLPLSAYEKRMNGISDGLFISSWIVSGIGEGCLVTSIPLLCVGYKKRDTSALETFNRKCAEPAITYNLTAGQNGLGLAINF